LYLSVVDHNGHPIPAAEVYGGDFEGASFSRRLGAWGLSSSGPNSSVTNSLSTLRSRQRALVRNNPLAGGGVDSLVANMIGTGIKPRWSIEDSELREQVQDLWNDSVNEMDADERCSFYGLQEVAARAMCNGGEALAQFRHVGPYDGLAVPLQIRVMEGDHLDAAYNTLADNGNEIRMGVEFDKTTNRRVRYHLWKNHPGDTFLNTDITTRIPVPASEILHVFRPLRPGQLRGLPWFASIILKLHDIDQCVDAELVNGPGVKP
jgi:lambda family phage portal protein